MFPSLNVFGACVRGIVLAAALLALTAAAEAHVSVLYAFKGGADGLSPSSGVIFDGQGNLYGTTWGGGGLACGGAGCGTIYKVTPYGAETLLYSFQGGAGDGMYPTNLIRDSHGNFYGTTFNGGTANFPGGSCGTVFKLARDGSETILHFFAGGSDGGNPAAGLLLDKAGNLYGTTEFGGDALDNGTLFRVAPDGKETVLYTFCSMPKCADGGGPQSTLIADQAGNLYGTTEYDGSGGGGTVFKFTRNGKLKTLYAFCSWTCQNGWFPQAGVTMDPAGNLYGTTNLGGVGGCGLGDTCGTVFEVNSGGKEHVLHAFDPANDGGNPASSVILDSAGNLYGTVGQSRAPACHGESGVVYRLAPDGSETIDCIASYITAGVIQRGGMLYGAATGGGNIKYPAGFVFAVRE